MIRDQDKKLSDEFEDYLFHVRRSIRYHNRRRLFFDRVSKCSDALTAIFGSATIITLVSTLNNIYANICAAFTAVLSSINLVFSTKEQARLHHDLARDFIHLEKTMIKMEENLSTEKLIEAQIKILDIEAEEPPILRVLDVICHNELCKAMGYGKSETCEVKWWQAIFANLFDLFPSKISKFDE